MLTSAFRKQPHQAALQDKHSFNSHSNNSSDRTKSLTRISSSNQFSINSGSSLCKDDFNSSNDFKVQNITLSDHDEQIAHDIISNAEDCSSIYALESLQNISLDLDALLCDKSQDQEEEYPVLGKRTASYELDFEKIEKRQKSDNSRTTLTDE